MRKNAKRTQRGRPFQVGNPGRPKGSRNKSLVAAELLLEDESQRLVRKAVDLALEGNVVALKLCLSRLIPLRRERFLPLAFPALRSAGDAIAATSAVMDKLSNGEISVGEAEALFRIVETYTNALFAHDFEQRLKVLEEANR